MLMYNLTEYSDNYSKYLEVHGNTINIIDVPDDLDNTSFKYKQKITGQTGRNGIKDVQIMVSLKCLSNFWGTLEMLLINCEINILLTCSDKCIILTRTGDN